MFIFVIQFEKLTSSFTVWGVFYERVWVECSLVITIEVRFIHRNPDDQWWLSRLHLSRPNLLDLVRPGDLNVAPALYHCATQLSIRCLSVKIVFVITFDPHSLFYNLYRLLKCSSLNTLKTLHDWAHVNCLGVSMRVFLAWVHKQSGRHFECNQTVKSECCQIAFHSI